MSTSSDFFDRQIRIPDWNQTLVSEQVCLCLGAGGLGTSVVLGLARLGVKTIHIVDFDNVEIHNLNRQVLFNLDSVGKSKAECAKEAAVGQHSLQSKVFSHHLDVTKYWPQIVQIAKSSTVIFNMIDIGDQFDIIVQSLALTLKLPLIQGGTFRTSLNLDIFSKHGSPCLWCANMSPDREFIEKVKPGDSVLALENLDFVHHDEHPIGASAVFVSLTAGQLMVANWINLLFYEKQIEDEKMLKLDSQTTSNTDSTNDKPQRQKPYSRIMMYLDNMDIDKFMVEPEVDCPLCPGKITQ